MSRILPPKDIFKLVKALDDLGMTPETIEKICHQAKVPLVHEIKFYDAGWFVWREVVSKVERSQNGAIELIRIVLEEAGDIEMLVKTKEKIETAKLTRLKNIAEALKNGTCVVFLGPEVLRVEQANGTLKSFNAHFCDWLEQEMDVARIYYDRGLRENVAYMAQCHADGDGYVPGGNGEEAARIYWERKRDDSFETRIFDHLAKLPVKLVINANPDDLLLGSLRKKPGVIPTTSFYDLSNHGLKAGETDEDKERKKKEEEKEKKKAHPEIVISAERPFIYNIFGSFDNVDSVLFTESQFMYFITSVIDRDPPLDSDVMTELIKKDTYLFLGFDFEQWYFKILFELFKLKKEEFAAVSIGYWDGAEMDPGISVFNKEFFEREFKIFFVADDIKKFLKELLDMML